MKLLTTEMTLFLAALFMGARFLVQCSDDSNPAAPTIADDQLPSSDFISSIDNYSIAQQAAIKK